MQRVRSAFLLVASYQRRRRHDQIDLKKISNQKPNGLFRKTNKKPLYCVVQCARTNLTTNYTNLILRNFTY
jgi:hypothetical protein